MQHPPSNALPEIDDHLGDPPAQLQQLGSGGHERQVRAALAGQILDARSLLVPGATAPVDLLPSDGSVGQAGVTFDGHGKIEPVDHARLHTEEGDAKR